MKYSLRTSHNNHFSNISGPARPPKEKYSLSQPKSVPKLIIRCTGDTAYDSYIAETLIPLRSAFKPRKQTRFESNPVTSIRHIPARCRSQTPTPRWNLDPLDPDLLIPIELSQASTGDSVQDLRESEAGEAYDTSIAHTPPSQPCGQIQAQRSENNSHDSIAHCRTDTPSQREIFLFRTATSSQSEIFSETSNASYSSYTETGTSTDIREEFTTPSQTSSKVTSSAYSSETSRTTTSSQSDLFTQTATEYDASSEASSQETSRPSSPESGNLTVRSVYSPLPEMAIVHKTMHDAIHTVRDQQGRAVTRRFLQQQEIAASKLKCMSQIRKTSTPDPPWPVVS